MNSEFYEYILEELLAAGANDVYFTPIQMKKNRPAVKLSVLAKRDILDDIVEVILKESTSLGVRVFDDVHRYCLKREFKNIETPWGDVTVKIGKLGDDIVNIAPEYEDCKRVARQQSIPLKKVYQYVQSKIED